MSDTLSAARALVPELARRADEIEAARRLPPDLSARFAEAGFYRMCVPATLGGLEQSPLDTARTLEELARGDGSAAWCAFIGATSGSALAQLPDEAAREVFDRPDRLVCGVFAPSGSAERTDGGFRVSGRWAWGSGVANADWVLAGCRLLRGGEPETDPRGAPRAHMMLVPAGEVELLDTWHVSGLCGTGSTDFVLQDVFVPERRAVGLLRPRPLERPLYAFPNFGLLAMGIGAVALGLAHAAVEELVDLADAKRPQASRRRLAERPSTQAGVAEAEAARRGARAFFYEALEAAWEQARREGRIDVAARRDVRLATTHAVRACAGAVDGMYHLAGGTSVYRRSPLQRIFRDVHVATQHMMVGPPTMEVAGRLLLGLETDVAQL